MIGLGKFPLAYFAESDERLGARFVTWLVLAIAEAQGIERRDVDARFIKAVFDNLPANQAERIREAGLEKICKIAAEGEMAEAGRLFREFMSDVAHRMHSEKFAAAHVKVRRGAKLGHAATHGTRDAKENRRAGYQAFINTLHKKNPSLSYEDLKKKAANHFDVSTKTIQRNTSNPRKAGESRSTSKVRTVRATVRKLP